MLEGQAVKGVDSKTLAQLKKAAAAHKKLNRYSAGVKAAGGRDATKKYDELNAKADAEIRKLPRGLRSRAILESFYE